MTLLNRPLTEDEARKMVDDWRKGWPAIVSLWDYYLNETTPHYVRYGADYGIAYVPPNRFWVGSRKHLTLPSDCIWIVPGTENDR